MKSLPESTPRSTATNAARRVPEGSAGGGWRAWLWAPVREFAGADGRATYLLPRWIVLRAVGLVFIIVFAGILTEGPALIGPGGLAPVGGFLAQMAKLFPGGAAFWHAPSLFWLGQGLAAIKGVAWAGMIAAVALTVNFAPRWALVGCWLALLSFVTTWQVFTATQVDQLMLETALLLIPLAPAGWRPGLGAASPPRSLPLFMARWLLFRVMFESGVLKLAGGDYHWLDLSAMDLLYETLPFPTVLGYWDHHLPHLWHVGETLLTYAAEIAAPLAAIWAGRRGRWFALAAWTLFQAGIQLTSNFGWLNTAAIALGVLLLDDQMLETAAGKLRWIKFPRVSLPPGTPVPATWRTYLLGTALWLHFALAATAFWALFSLPEASSLEGRLQSLVAPWRSANAYTLYGTLRPWHLAVEFSGSNDGGRTWRTWEFRHLPQQEDRRPEFLAPWYARFEATLQAKANPDEPSELYAGVAAHLIARTPAVLALFAHDPFPDAPPVLVRIRSFRLSFVDPATWRRTGRYWRREDLGDFQPMMYRTADGQIVAATTPEAELQALALNGNPTAQSTLGLLFAKGEGRPRDLAAAVQWCRRAAEQGDETGQFFLGLSYLSGEGVGLDKTEAARWFRLAAEQGHVLAQHNLGVLLLRGEGVRRDPPEALVWFGVAALAGDERAARNRDVVAAELGPVAAAEAAERSKVIFSRMASGRAGP